MFHSIRWINAQVKHSISGKQSAWEEIGFKLEIFFCEVEKAKINISFLVSGSEEVTRV